MKLIKNLVKKFITHTLFLNTYAFLVSFILSVNMFFVGLGGGFVIELTEDALFVAMFTGIVMIALSPIYVTLFVRKYLRKAAYTKYEAVSINISFCVIFLAYFAAFLGFAIGQGMSNI